MKRFRDTKYLVSEDGKVWSEMSERFLKPSLTVDGYQCVKLHNKSFRVHRLIAEVYIPNLENKPEVNHINGIKSDNCIENLEWVTGKENVKHAFRLGLITRPKGTDTFSCKLKESDILEIRELYKSGNYSQQVIADSYCVSQHLISLIVRRKNWKHI